MFRNEKMQRAIATVLLAAFSSTSIAQTVATAQTAAATASTPAGFVPLQRRDNSVKRNSALLPLNANGLAIGKGQAAIAATAAAAPVLATSDAYSQAMWSLQEVATAKGKSGVDRLVALRAQYQAAQKLEAQVTASFAQTEARLRAAGLPKEILDRHTAAATDYAKRTTALGKAMAGLGDAASLQALSALLEQFPSQSGNGKKSAALPWGHAKAKGRTVALDARQHERLFPRSIQLAANGTLSGIALPDAILGAAPVAADLAATDDVQLTPDIRTLAAKLSNDPVQIYNWVRNNVSYTVGYGVMQGAAATMRNGKGNAYDTASLLIALYRAANIPARYVYGTVEVPGQRMQNWLGLDSTVAAQTLLSAAGIPNRATTQAGQVAAIQFEHVWVQALVDYGPGRGTGKDTANTWVELDPSFKLATEKSALDLRGAVSVNDAALLDGARAGAMCTAESAQNLNAANLQEAYKAYVAKVSNFLAQQGVDLTVGDVLGSRRITPENYSILLGSLPYKTVATGAVVSALPEALRWQYRFQLFADAAAQSQGRATVELNNSFSSLAGKRITLSFAPATAADAATLAAFMPKAHTDGSLVTAAEFPADIPGYLIRVKAELRAGGNVVASGGSFVLGAELQAELGAVEAGVSGFAGNAISLHAGDYHAFAIDAQGIAAPDLDAVNARLGATQAKLAAGQAGALTRDDVTGDMLYQSVLAYFATADSNAAVFQRASGVVAQRLPSHGRAVAPVKPQMALGIVNKVSFPGVTLAIDRMDSAVASKTSGLSPLAYARQSNERDSAYGHLVLAKLYGSTQAPVPTISAVKALAAATAQGQVIYAVTAANLPTVQPLLALSNAAATRLQDAVGAGYRVLVAQGPVATGGWLGYPLQIEDPASGAGAYELIDDIGNANAGAYPLNGAGWLALAQPFQSALAIAPAMKAGQDIDTLLVASLNAATTRWSYFAGQVDVASGLFLSHIAQGQGAQVCDAVTGIIAANLGTASGLEQNGNGVAAAPVITSVPQSAGAAGLAYRYAASATDSQNLPLTWSLPEAPGGMRIGTGGVLSWDTPVSGSFSVTVRADNGRAYAEQRYLLTVGNEAIPLEISLSVAPAIIDAGQSVTITLLSNGGSGTVNRTLAIDGAAVALNAAGQAVVTGTVMGAHQIAASVADSKGTVSKSSFYSVRNPGDIVAPLALIKSPVDDAEVTAPLIVTGTATDANLAYYQLLLRAAGSEEWQEIGRGTKSVADGTLGKLDPTQLRNGIYELVLNVVDANGQATNQMITVDIYRDLKIGQFSISFEDLNVDASGIPVRVTRTYDTRRKGESLDFGHGWSVDYQNVQISKNMVLGTKWEVTTKQVTSCLTPIGKHKINIVLPDGKVERFTAANATECRTGPPPLVDVRFTSMPGTNSTLEVDDGPLVLYQGGKLYVPDDGGDAWNPRDFKLTTDDNYVYYLTDGIGITRVKDPFGNTLTYGQNGILHSNGQSVAFSRDAANRITALTDPAGNKINYTYTATGDLASVTDRTGAVAKFSYNRSHGLTDFSDPSGAVTARYTYDADGRLVSVMDAAGKAIESTNDIASNKQVVKDRRGNSTTYIYDGEGNITQITDALGRTTTMTFDALGNDLTVTDALGKTTTKTFDPRSGKQLSQTNALGKTMTWAYDPTSKQLSKSVDALQNATEYEYFATAQLTHEPLGRESALRTDAAGNPTSVNLHGLQTSYTSDPSGRRLTQTDAAGNVTTFVNDVLGNEIGRTWTRLVNGVAQQVSTQRKVDAEGRALEQTDALGNVTKTSYTPGGQISSSTDAQGRMTRFDYDARGKLVKTTYPDDSVELTSYDENGNQSETTDRQGRTTHFGYDKINRLVSIAGPDGATSRTSYDELGRVASTIDALGRATVNRFDETGRILSVTDADNKVTRYAYDANGNRTDLWDANGKQTRYEYDALNRLVKTILPTGKSATTVWNVDGTKSAETDYAGLTSQFGYDPLARLNKVTLTSGAGFEVTSFAYDAQGNKVGQTDAEGRTTTWAYDAGNALISRTLPGQQQETFSYDSAGNLSSRTDFSGNTTRFGYDSLYRQNLETRPDGSTITTTYSIGGNVDSVRVSASAASGLQAGSTTYTYDALDRVTRQTNPDGSFLSYGYDANGQITQRSTNSGTVTYEYDVNQRLSRVTDYAGKLTSYTYDAVGNPLTVSYPNGVLATYQYDAAGRLLQLLHSKGSTIVAGVRYKLDGNGHRTEVAEFDSASVLDLNGVASPARTRKYRYDSALRLVEEIVEDKFGTVARTIGYSYDKVGNRIEKTDASGTLIERTSYKYDSNDRLLEEKTLRGANALAVTIYAWDKNGNLRTKTVGANVTVYIWNTDNRLIEVKQGATEVGASSLVKYFYDADGNRTRSEQQDGTNAVVTRYLVDNTFNYARTLMASVQTSAGAETTNFVWGVALIGQQGSSERYFHSDGLQSVVATTDANAKLSGTMAYSAFGELEASSSSSASLHGFTGEQYDELAGLQYNRERWYDPRVGRFVSVDAFPGINSRPTTLHKYVYVGNDPLNRTDPSGLNDLGSVAATLSLVNTISNAYMVGNIVFQFAIGNVAGGAGMIAEEVVFSKFGGAFGKQIVHLTRNQVGILFNVFKNGVKLKQIKLGNPSNSADLIHNLEAVGVPKPSNTQAHHIVGAATRLGKDTQNKLKSLGIDLNSAMNGVFLPGCSGKSKAIGMIHCGKHTAEYEGEVAARLSSATTNVEAINILSEIRNELLSNTFSKLNIRAI